MDITFDFLLNSISKGIFHCLQYMDTQTLNTTWTPVIDEGNKKIRMVSIVNKTYLNVNANISQS